MDERFAARLKAARARPRTAAIWVAVATLVMAAVVYVVAFAPIFTLDDVVVTGGSKDVATVAEKNARAPIGRPLARVDTEAIASRVAVDPRIEQVEVRREWPSGLVIDVTTRTPAAVVKQPGTALQLVDATGVIYDEVSKPPTGLPQIGAPAGDVDPGSLAGAVQARNALGDPFAEQVTAMSVTADGDLRFALGVVDVQWGRPDRVELKAAATRALLAQKTIDPDGERPMTIDVTAPQTPVVTGLPVVPRG
ncbi:MAG: FtsQ-type POTRA domain-containing protein [Ornithinimicrobium sp.]